MNNNKIFGVIGMLAGGGIVAYWWFNRASTTGSDGSEVGMQATQAYLAVFGAVLFLTGLSALFKKSFRYPWSKR